MVKNLLAMLDKAFDNNVSTCDTAPDDNSDVENLIKQLALFRKSMKPEISRTVSDGNKEGPVDPLWTIPSRPESEEKVLGIRHDGLGWLWFFLPKEEARKLGNALLVQSQYAPTSQNPSTDHRH